MNAGFIQGRIFFHFFPCLPLIAVLRSPHLKVYDFSEKTKPFYCPSGTKFSTKSKNLSQTTQSSCSLKSSCIGFPDGCTAFSFSTLMNKQFEVVIISLYSSEQKCNLWTIYIKIYTTHYVPAHIDIINVKALPITYSVCCFFVEIATLQLITLYFVLSERLSFSNTAANRFESETD